METKDFTNEQNQPEKGASMNESETASTKSIITEPATNAELVVKASPTEELQFNPATEQHYKDHKTKHALPSEDYSIYDKATLLIKFNELINLHSTEETKDLVEEIKTNFYKKHKAEYAEAKQQFIDSGGIEEEFKMPEDSAEETFKELYNQYKEQKNEYNQIQEEEKQKNLKAKYQIVDEIKDLINNEESINKTFQEFRDLQQRWRDIGLVPQSEVKNLWENYNHHVEKFYDYIKINKELRDLDLKKNLEHKIELCEKAESLLLEESVTRAFKTLQDFHVQWREIGPVPREQKDDIWERFKDATTKINKKHQEYFEGLKDQQIKNLEQKTALCERVEEIVKEGFENPKNWEDKAHEIIEVQKIWRTIGFAPKKENNKVYNRFKAACDQFFAAKRDFYKGAKEVQKNNLQYKLDLCVQAEALKDSTEWKKTTEDFVNLQKRWKEIGPVPKKHSEILWKRFRTACDAFFTKKSDFFNKADSRQEDNLKLKLELIEKVKNFKKSDNEQENLKTLIDIQKQWAEIGHVPLAKKDEIQKEFRDGINSLFENLKIEATQREKMNYKSKVENWVGNQSRSKLYSERNKLVTKIKELENEIALYENNIGFFSKSSNSNALMAEVSKKIQLAKERMESMKEKLRMLDSMDQE